jgi:hypothetical protein
MEFLEPWYAESSSEFVNELRREIAPSHERPRVLRGTEG